MVIRKSARFLAENSRAFVEDSSALGLGDHPANLDSLEIAARVLLDIVHQRKPEVAHQ